MQVNQLPIICLMGPTAVGKSQLAIDLAKTLPCDIISVDSVMVYRGMDIGSAKPDRETLARIPHRLVDIRDPIHPYSAGDFFRDVEQVIQESLQNQRIPLLVGGTMLYFNTLRKGLVDLPHYNKHIDYCRLKTQLAHMSLEELYCQLKKYDKPTAQRLHLHDRQRIQHALLVYYLSGKPLSELHHSHQKRLPYSITWMAVYPTSRQALRERIAHRFETMLSQGMIEEVAALARKPSFLRDLPAFRAVGYRQTLEYLTGNINFETLKANGTTATCQLAKRQLTWLRSWPELKALYAQDPKLLKIAREHIQSKLIA